MAPAPAATASNPYINVITNRNVFALKEPPDPSKAPPPPPPNVPAVKLAGITTVMGGKRAILRVPRPARPPVPAGESSMILAEGAPAEDGIQVLEINIAAATVRINNNGTTQTLDLDKDAPKSAPAAPAIPVPGQPGAIPVPQPAVAPAPGGVASFARPVRGAGPAGGGEAANSQGVPGAGPAGVAAPQPPPPLSLEEQEVMIEVNRMRDAEKIAAGDLPPYPPTELQGILNQEQQAQEGGPPRMPL